MREGESETVERHPDSDTLLAFREHRLSGLAVIEVALHVETCAPCATLEPSAGRTVFEALIAQEVGDQLAEPESSSNWWLIAATVAFTVLALSAITLTLRRDEVPATATKPSASVAPAPVAPPAPAVTASLVDGSNRIALLDDGTIAGVELRSSRDADDARAVLSGRSIAIPTFIAAMPGAVRGDAARAHPLRAIEPFRSAVLEARPRFSWASVPDARTYRVAVFDADYEEIARSEVLTRTSWTAPQPLPADVDLSWHVVADTGSGEISSAGVDRAESVFRVLTPIEAAEVNAGKAHYRDSHLLRGLLYSRHGLLHDAEAEFRALAKQNPGSPIARALIDTVSR
jgi:hypothetical protein